MTEKDATRLVLMLTYNFAGFMPPEPHGAAIKKSTWISELLPYDIQNAEAAVKLLIQTAHFPPQIADFRELVGQRAQREPVGIPGPTFGTQEGYDAMYTADMDRVNALMAKLMEEL